MMLFGWLISNVGVSLHDVMSTVSWRYGNIFHLVGFMSLLEAEEVNMKCNSAGNSL